MNCAVSGFFLGETDAMQSQLLHRGTRERCAMRWLAQCWERNMLCNQMGALSF